MNRRAPYNQRLCQMFGPVYYFQPFVEQLPGFCLDRHRQQSKSQQVVTHAAVLAIAV